MKAYIQEAWATIRHIPDCECGGEYDEIDPRCIVPGTLTTTN